MKDPRNAHTILIGGFEEQRYKSNNKRMYNKHYIKTNLVDKLFSKWEIFEVWRHLVHGIFLIMRVGLSLNVLIYEFGQEFCRRKI